MVKASSVMWLVPQMLGATYYVVAYDAPSDILTWAKAAQAAGSNVWVCDGAADDVEIQAAINALPAGGGELAFSSGNFVLSATVTRAIANITITGVGKATYFAHDAGTALFTAGGNNWVYSNFRVDTTTAQLTTAMGATTLWSWENVTTSDGQFAYKTDDLTTAANWAIPTGRSATYVIAASDAPAHVKAQADEVLTGTSMETQINAALTTLNALGTHQSLALFGTFECDGTVNTVSNVDVIGNNSTINVTIAGNGYALYMNNITNSVWQDLDIYRKGNIGNVSTQCVYITGNDTDQTCVLRRINATMQVTSTFVGEGKLNGLFIGQYFSPSPLIEDCVFTANQANCADTYLNDGIDVHILIQDQQTTPVLGYAKLVRCTGIAGFGSLSSGIAATEADGAEFIDCIGDGGIGKDGWAINDCSPKLTGCKGFAGLNNGTGIPSGFRLWCGGSPVMKNCEGVQSKTAVSDSLRLSHATSPIITGFYGHPYQESLQWYYDDANNGRFRPFSTQDYGVRSISMWVSHANAGVTMKLGITPGGNEIANNIDIGTGGTIAFSFTPLAVVAGSYIYATPSAPIADDDIFIYYTAVYAVPTARNFTIDTVGFARVSHSTFEGCTQDGFSLAMNITATSAAIKNWRLDYCTFENLCTAVGRGLYSDAAITDAPVYNCMFINAVAPASLVTSLAMGSNTLSRSGWWQVANGQNHVHVTHGLGWTPAVGDIAIGFTTLDASKACFIDGYSATEFVVNIDVNATAATTTGWWKAIR